METLTSGIIDDCSQSKYSSVNSNGYLASGFLQNNSIGRLKKPPLDFGTNFEAIKYILNRFKSGLILLNDKGSVTLINAMAKRMISTSGSFIIMKNGQFKFANGKSEKELRRVIALSHLSIEGADRSKIHQLSVRNRATGTKLLVEILPVVNKMTSNATVILIIDPNSTHHFSTDGLSRVFNLTPSEKNITESLVNGLSMHDIASKRGTALATVRGQLKNIFSKTGVNSQLELMRLLFSSLAIMG